METEYTLQSNEDVLYCTIYPDDYGELKKSLDISGIQYKEMILSMNTVDSKNMNIAEVSAKAKDLWVFLCSFMSAKKISIQINEKDKFYSVDLSGYSKDDAIKLLKVYHKIYITSKGP